MARLSIPLLSPLQAVIGVVERGLLGTLRLLYSIAILSLRANRPGGGEAGIDKFTELR